MLPDEWSKGEFNGVCARGGFELWMEWEDHEITRVEVLSKFGNLCRINAGGKLRVRKDGKSIRVNSHEDGSIFFNTVEGGVYTLLNR